MTVRRNLRTIACAALALVISGCSNNPNAGEWNSESTYYIPFGAEPTTFDPSTSYNAGDAESMDLIYPCYFCYNVLKQKPWEFNLNIGLIEPIREKNSVGEKWTFELRHDLRYQDDPCFPGGKGRNVTAKDMEYSFKRLANPKSEFPLHDNLIVKMPGYKEYEAGFKQYGDDNYDRPFPAFQLDPNNPYRFSVQLNTVYPQFKYLMAMHFTTPIPREAVDTYKEDFKLKHPVGCGPYMQEEYSEHKRIVLVPNPNCTYRAFPASGSAGLPQDLVAYENKKIPVLKRIVFNIILEPMTSYNLFDQGYVDSLGIGQGNAQQMVRTTKPGGEMIKRGVVVREGAYPSMDYMAFNMEDATFGGYSEAHKKLRQAISLSIDSEQYIDLMFQGIGYPAQWIIPRGLCGFDANYKNPYRQYDPSLTKAKQLLSEAGYPNGIDPKTGERLKLILDNIHESATDSLRAEFMLKQIERLGIKVVINDLQYSVFSDEVNHKKAQAFTYAWIADYPDAENFCMLLYGPNESPAANNANYKSPEYDKLFQQIQAMDDSPERAELINKMRDIAVDDCPWIYLAEDEAPTAFQPWVKAKISNPIVNDLMMYREVDGEQRVRLQREWNTPVVGPVAIIIGVLVIVGVPAFATVRRQKNRSVRRKASTGGND